MGIGTIKTLATVASIPALNIPHALKEELPAYLAKALDVSPTINELE